MTWALVNPTSGYSTFSRFVSLRVRPSIWTSTAVSLATFAHDLSCRLVAAETLEGGGAELAAARPFHELELGHDLRLDEVRGPWRLGSGAEGVRLCGERLQLVVELVERLVREAGPDLAGVDEPAVAVVVADQQGAGVAAALPFAVEPAADDELLPVAVLDLEPRAAAAPRLVLGLEALGHHAFEPSPC